LSAPKGTPRPIIDKIAAVARQALGDPETQKALEAQGYAANFLGPDDFRKFYANEVAKWSKVAEAVGALSD
jgi:tripartite-type tricarboxylate transporter receptor subunit TctC